MSARERLRALCEELGLSYTENLRTEWGVEISVADARGNRWQTTARTLDKAADNLEVMLAAHEDGAALRLLREGVGRAYHTRQTWVGEGVQIEAWRRGDKAAPRFAATGRTFAEAAEKLLEQVP